MVSSVFENDNFGIVSLTIYNRMTEINPFGNGVGTF